ncbi:MAG: hypothetical protein SFY96_10465 [Planctomycetota bacterium]|nr:hypothetical protein [Planctomycetota bacterium]
MPDAAREHVRRRVVQLGLLGLACVLVFWLPLAASPGLFDSEAQRVLPGWTMHEGGDAFVPHLFERPYARKPPGMPWAVAASAAVFGEYEVAARAVSALSATLLALGAFFFAARWMPRAWQWTPLIAGLGQVCLPVLWPPSTAGEIEMLHNLWAGLAAWCVLDLLLMRDATRVSRVLMALGAATACSAMIVTKGPAALPVVGAAVVVGCVCARKRGVRVLPRAAIVACALLAGLALAAAVLLEMKRRIALLPPELVVLQDPREFLWNLSRLGGIVSLPIAGWASALPASLVVLMLLPARWMGGALGERGDATQDDDVHVGRTLAWVFAIALAIFTLSGVSNPRYLMPAVATLGPGIAALVSVVVRKAEPAETRRRGRAIGVACVVLVVTGAVFGVVLGLQRARGSGLTAAHALAPVLIEQGATGPITIWADGAIETRAELPHYLQRIAADAGRQISVRWWPILTSPPPFGPGDVYLLRHDDEMDEWKTLADAGRAGPVMAQTRLKDKWVFALAPAGTGAARRTEPRAAE